MQFSIITVCRNDLKGLKMTYNSVIKQTYKDFEWIIIDGNSSDGTKQWLNNLSQENIYWISESDKGIFDAMNKGIKHARGKYLHFLNSFDEFADKEVLNKVNSFISFSGQELKFIYGDSIDITQSGTNLYRKSRHYKTLWRGMFTQHQAMFFKSNKNIIFKPNYKITADYAYIGHFLKDLNEHEIGYLETAVCKFKLGGTNENYRLVALNEDFNIRKNEFGINVFLCHTLYLLHFLHTIQKRFLPATAKLFRYNRV